MEGIVNKIEFIGSDVLFTPIGYLPSQAACDAINAKHDSTLGAWVEDNLADLETGVVLISTFFETTPLVYVARTSTTNLAGLDEVTDITEMV